MTLGQQTSQYWLVAAICRNMLHGGLTDTPLRSLFDKLRQGLSRISAVSASVSNVLAKCSTRMNRNIFTYRWYLSSFVSSLNKR